MCLPLQINRACWSRLVHVAAGLALLVVTAWCPVSAARADCPPAATSTDCANGLPAYLERVCDECGTTIVWNFAGGGSSIGGGGGSGTAGCDLPTEVLQEALCSFADQCSLSCSSLAMLIQQAQQALGRQLTGDEIAALMQCLGCSPGACGEDPCPITTDADGDSNDCTCDDLVTIIICAEICAAREPTPRTLTDTEIAAIICEFVNQCDSVNGFSCRQALGCLKDELGIAPSFELIIGLVECVHCDLCKSEPNDPCQAVVPADCDANGDGQVNCEDFEIIIATEIVCSLVHDCDLPDEDRLAELAEEFFCNGTCAAWDCKDITACMLSIGLFSSQTICEVLACSNCTGGTCPSNPSCEDFAETMGIGSMSEPACDQNGDGEKDGKDLVIIIQQGLCCWQEHCSEKELDAETFAEGVCTLVTWFITNCRTDLDACDALEMVLDALRDAGFGIVYDPEFLTKVLACTNCDTPSDPRFDWVREYLDGLVGRGSCGQPGDSAGSGDTGNEQGGGKGSGHKGGRGPGNSSEGGVICPAVYPSSCGKHPVSFISGSKLEGVVDVSVALAPQNFELVRTYSSDSAASGGGMVGAGWTMSSFRYITVVDTNDPPVAGDSDLKITLNGPGARERRDYTYSSSDSRWVTTGPSTQYFTKVTSLSGEPFLAGHSQVWRFTEPGAYTWDFADENAGELAGLLLQRTDVYGRREVYSYILVGPTSGTKAARLSTIHLGVPKTATSLDDADAVVGFDWNIATGDTAVKGKLKRIRVARKPSVSSAWVTTNEVDYLYYSTSGPAGVSGDVGGPGDLIQVTHSTLLNADDGSPSPRYHRQVTQYRYHDGGDAPTEVAERLTVVGAIHALKMVILPQQVEFATQKLIEVGSIGAIPALDDRILAGASKLITFADDDFVGFQDGEVNVILADLASKVVGYTDEDSTTIHYEYLQTACGCSGSAQGLRQEYTYYSTGSGQGDKLGVRVDENVYDSESTDYEPYRVMYYDLVRMGSAAIPYLVNEVVSEVGSTPRQWATHYNYDDSASRNLLVKKFTASAITAYTPFDSGSSSTTPAVTLNIDSTPPYAGHGLVYGYAYTAENRPSELRVHTADSSTALDISGYELLWRLSYDSTNKWLLAQEEHFRTATTTGSGMDPDDVEVVTHDFKFHSGTTALASHEVSVEAELEEENGPGSPATYDTYTLYNELGQVRWRRDADKALTFYAYDAKTGAITRIVRNADTTQTEETLDGDNYGGVDESGWGRTADGGELVTTYTNDLMGRTVARTAPGGISSYTIRTVAEPLERPGMPYYTVLGLPHRLPAAGSDPASFDGPASLVIMDAGGNTIQSSDYELDPATAYDPVGGVYHIVTSSTGAMASISRSTTQHNLPGQVKSVKRWHAIDPANPNTGFYQDTFTYDNLGRLATSENANGTITERADYDVLDRVLEVKIGTGPSDMKTVAEYFYDSNGTATQGVGNGNLTFIKAYEADSTARSTTRKYDDRDRLVMTVPPEAPYEVIGYDNLNRAVKRAVYPSVPGTPDPDDDTDRGLFSVTSYSQRGLVYRQQVAIDPTDTGVGFLESHTWFDEDGRAICQWAPNSPAVKREYDGLGRPKAVYTTNRGFDEAPGAPDNYDTAKALLGDDVLEQVNYTYNTGSPRHDRVELVTSRVRNHDEAPPTSGSTAGALTNSTSVATFVGYIYDAADRQIRTVNFGTADAATSEAPTGWFQNGTAPTWPPSEMPDWDDTDWDDTIITGTAYNTRGLVETTIDPYPNNPSSGAKSRVTKVLYDDLNRRTAVIENYKNAVVGWLGGSDNRWSVTSGLDAAHPDEDRVTSFVYDGSGNVTKQVAHLPDGSGGEKVQVTQYVYGTTAPSSPTSTDSLVASGDLLKEVRYPDESTGEAGTSDTYKVKYAYNQLGELRAVTDQNGTIHTYVRDDIGRVTRDDAATLGTDIDANIRAIEVKYDAFGRLDWVKSRSVTGGSGGSILNAVQFTYTPLWQVATIAQDVDGDLNSNSDIPTRTVAYHYDNQPVGSGNYSRQDQLVYPDGTEVDMLFSSSSSPDDTISRLTGMEIPGSPPISLVDYRYVGANMFASVYYPEQEVQLDRTLSADGKRRFSDGTTSYTSQNASVYPGWDRFGRVRYHAWVDTALHNVSGSLPDRPQIVADTHTYDRASNRLTRFDNRPDLNYLAQDNIYTYDGLDRLIQADRGTWNAGGAALTYGSIGPILTSQQWDLDMLGNWKEFIRDASGNGTYGDSTDLVDDRNLSGAEHNAANEIVKSSIRHDGASPTPSPVPFSYDDAGNIKTAQMETTNPSVPNLVNRRYIHDAWNRLVEVIHNNGTAGTTSDDFTLARYLYNGLHWRVWKQANMAEAPAYSSPTPQVVQRRAMFYDAAWRLIHQEMDDGVAPGSNLPTWPVSQGTWTPDRAEQLFWGARYIDDAVGRRQSTAVTDADDPAPTVTWGDLQHYLTDAQFSVMAVMDTGKAPGYDVIERARYTPYGFGLQSTPRDYNGSGQYSADDISAAIGYYAGAQFMGDVNRSGNISVDDWIVFATLNNTAFADAPDSSGWISHPDAANGGHDNCIGYCGYIHNPETGDYTVRFRTYLPGLGRWGERDPAGYVDGANLFAYIARRITTLTDPLGLRPPTEEETQVIERLKRLKQACSDSKEDPIKRQTSSVDQFIAWLQKQIEGVPEDAKEDPCELRAVLEALKLWNKDDGTQWCKKKGANGVKLTVPNADPVAGDSYKCNAFVSESMSRCGKKIRMRPTGRADFRPLNGVPVAHEWGDPSFTMDGFCMVGDPANLKPGDIVYFDLSGNTDHVGIFLYKDLYISARNVPNGAACGKDIQQENGIQIKDIGNVTRGRRPCGDCDEKKPVPAAPATGAPGVGSPTQPGGGR